MRKLVRGGLGLVAASLFVAVGCGDDDDSGSTGTGGASSGGQSTTGGSTGKGGSGGAATGGSSAGGKSTGGTTSGGSGGNGGAANTIQCEAIGELCHAVDDGNGPLHECHELGHSADPTVCSERFGACVTACVAAGEQGEGGAGGASAGGAGGGEAQSPYCVALGELCHPVASVSAELEECHEIGHVGEARRCLLNFPDCATACLAAREAAEGGGGANAGGAGGVNAGGASAGGVNAGGASAGGVNAGGASAGGAGGG